MKQIHIFDCDGVIVDSEILAIDVLLQSLQPYGFQSDVQRWAKDFSGFRTRDILDMLREKHGLALPSDFYEQNRALAKQRFQREMKAVPGMPNLIRSLPGQHAVVSNSKQNHVAMCLDKAGLSNHFGSHIYTSDMVVNSKPAPDLYLLALEKLEVKAEDCIVVEDSVAGARSAIAAGLAVIGFVGGLHLDDRQIPPLLEVGVRHIARNAAELKNLLRNA